MKHKDFIDELLASGVWIENGTNHLKLYYKGKASTCPRPPSQEISNVLQIK